MKSFRVLISFLLLLSLIHCSKKESASNSAATKDTTAPSITIVSPSNNQTFTSGASIQVAATATDDVKVTELHIHVINKATGALLRDIHSYPAAKSGSVQDAFAAQAGLVYTIKIIALDPSQNLATAQVEVLAN